MSGWIIGIISALGIGLLGFLKGKPWWSERRRSKKAIEAEEKKLDEAKEIRDEERENRRADFHSKCPFDE